MAWFMQIKRMGDGNNPSMKLGILKAYRLNGKDEKRVLKKPDV